MMDNERKQLVIQSLIQLMQSSPDMQKTMGRFQNDSDYLEQKLVIWINYINSILDVAYQYTRLNSIVQTKMVIGNLFVQQNMTVQQRTNEIKNELLRLMNEIIWN